MSWIFGYFGNTEKFRINIPETALHSFQNSNLILHIGGNKQTALFKKNDQSTSCWAAAGVGLVQSGDGYKILNASDWGKYLNSAKIDLGEINGHFVIVKYDDNELQFFTDELGLREIHLVKLPDGFGFTTRIDWLKYFINPEIDLQEFGSRWLLQNQISSKSIIKNVIRLVCAKASIKNNSLKVEEYFWQPDIEANVNKDEFDLTLNKLLNIDGRKILLSLSGGLDSRLLLSYLINKNLSLWEVHTFGDPDHPDSRIASKLLNAFNIKNKIISSPFPKKEKTIELLSDYAVHSMVSGPISQIINTRFYNQVAGENNIIIDGGFGEIWRRQFANRLLIFGGKALLEKNSGKIYRLLKHNKPDIFSDEMINEMEKGVIKQIENIFLQLPNVNEFGFTNWVDLFSIRTRLTNYYAPEQSRVDNYAVSFMPLVQKQLLKLLFTFGDNEKKHGKLFKELIKKNSFLLTKHPLVKGNIIHPFNSSSLSVRFYTRIKNRFGLSYKSKQPAELFNLLREFINDSIRSSEVRNCEF